MGVPEVDVVTGAFGYTGKYITRRLLSEGRRVRTITGRTDRPNPFGDRIQVAPFRFDRLDELCKSLEGAATLYNTYWVRFPHGRVTYASAIENSRRLFEAARKAHVTKVVHVSIANPSPDSLLPYYSGKAAVEKALAESGLSHAIVRPTVIFGPEDILINNIAWLLRHFPLFAIPGSGKYRIRPVFVEDMARIAVEAGRQEGNTVTDAVGPETFTYEELVRLLRDKTGAKARIFHAPPGVVALMAKFIQLVVMDVMITRDEVRGLMADLLATQGPATGQTRLSEWLDRNGKSVGARYASELARHYR
jgi:NADH dehydrogenase